MFSNKFFKIIFKLKLKLSVFFECEYYDQIERAVNAYPVICNAKATGK